MLNADWARVIASRIPDTWLALFCIDSRWFRNCFTNDRTSGSSSIYQFDKPLTMQTPERLGAQTSHNNPELSDFSVMLIPVESSIREGSRSRRRSTGCSFIRTSARPQTKRSSKSTEYNIHFSSAFCSVPWRPWHSSPALQVS